MNRGIFEKLNLVISNKFITIS